MRVSSAGRAFMGAAPVPAERGQGSVVCHPLKPLLSRKCPESARSCFSGAGIDDRRLCRRVLEDLLGGRRLSGPFLNPAKPASRGESGDRGRRTHQAGSLLIGTHAEVFDGSRMTPHRELSRQRFQGAAAPQNLPPRGPDPAEPSTQRASGGLLLASPPREWVLLTTPWGQIDYPGKPLAKDP